MAPFADLSTWLSLFYGITYVTGGYNTVTPSAVILPVAVLVISMALVNGYRLGTDFASLHYAAEHLMACFAGYLLAALLLYVVASFGPMAASSRGIYTMTVFGFAVVTLFTRRIFWFSTARWREEGRFLAIVDEVLGPKFYRDYVKSGQHQTIRYLAAEESQLGSHVGGEGSPELKAAAPHLLPHLDHESAPTYEGIIVAADFNRLPADVIRRLGTIHFEEMPVFSMESFYKAYWSRMPLELIGPTWPLEADFVLVQHSAYSALKRLFDLLFSLLALVILSPLMLLVSLAVLVFDGRPIFYSQKRIGLHEHPFTIHKFRSMRCGSDKGDRYTQVGDPRVTRLGALLRKSRLDELPQLWNVLKGDMSLIGPRAEWDKLVDDYEGRIPHYHFRHLVRPGITGWAQVNYPYGANLEDTLQKLSFDLYYIRHFSMRLDAEVILKTFHIMAFGKGR
jgi:exopolysaccharide biosynthesis polyprenyl glycosylphosphotransferase